MIAEILAIAGAGAAVYTALDHENMLPWSQTIEKKFWWEKPPFVPTTPPVTQARFTQPIQPRLSPTQELSQARMAVVGAEQQLAAVSRKYPALAVTSKYMVTTQGQQFIQPYHPNQGYGQ